MGVLKINLIKDAEELFMVTNSEAKQNEKFFKKIFHNTETVHKNFYLHQLLDLGTGAEINFRVRGDPNANILEKKYFDEILTIHQNIIENIVANETIRFEDVCATRGNNKCWIEGSDLLSCDAFFKFLKKSSLALRNNETDSIIDPMLEDVVYMNEKGEMNFMAASFGKKFKFILNDDDPLVQIESNQTYAYACVFKIRYQMKYNIALKNKNVLLWEREFLKYIKNLKTTHVSFTFSTSGSLGKKIL